MSFVVVVVVVVVIEVIIVSFVVVVVVVVVIEVIIVSVLSFLSIRWNPAHRKWWFAKPTTVYTNIRYLFQRPHCAPGNLEL